MKYARFTVFLGMMVSVLVAQCGLAAEQSTEKAQGQWKVVLPKTNVGDKIRMAAFFNQNFGMWGGAGDVGKAHFTLDGGKTWAKADSSGG